MKAYRAHIVLLIQADSDGKACDAVAESLRPVLVEPLVEAGIVDWRYRRCGFRFTAPVLAPDIDLSTHQKEDLIS